MFQLSPSNTKVVSPNTLPEVKQSDRLSRCVCEDVLLQVALRKCVVAAQNALIQRALTMIRGHCVEANNALKNALQQVKQTKTMRIKVLPRIENSSHHNALDAITQSVLDLNKELSITLERKSVILTQMTMKTMMVMMMMMIALTIQPNSSETLSNLQETEKS